MRPLPERRTVYARTRVCATLWDADASYRRAMSKFADIQIDTSIVKRAARGDARAHEIIYRAFATSGVFDLSPLHESAGAR